MPSSNTAILALCTDYGKSSMPFHSQTTCQVACRLQPTFRCINGLFSCRFQQFFQLQPSRDFLPCCLSAQAPFLPEVLQASLVCPNLRERQLFFFVKC